MGLFDELKGDAMRSGAIIGVLIAFVAMFWMYSAFGLLGFAIVAIIGIAGYFVYMRSKNG
jgi:hypothetical protein